MISAWQVGERSCGNPIGNRREREGGAPSFRRDIHGYHISRVAETRTLRRPHDSSSCLPHIHHLLLFIVIFNFNFWAISSSYISSWSLVYCHFYFCFSSRWRPSYTPGGVTTDWRTSTVTSTITRISLMILVVLTPQVTQCPLRNDYDNTHRSETCFLFTPTSTWNVRFVIATVQYGNRIIFITNRKQSWDQISNMVILLLLYDG